MYKLQGPDNSIASRIFQPSNIFYGTRDSRAQLISVVIVLLSFPKGKPALFSHNCLTRTCQCTMCWVWFPTKGTRMAFF